MLLDDEADEPWTTEEQQRLLLEWGTTDATEIGEIEHALAVCDVKFLARHLRETTSPGRRVCEALATMLDPPSVQDWTLKPMRRRGRPRKQANIALALEYNKLALGHPELKLKAIDGHLAKGYRVSDRTIRASKQRLSIHEPRQRKSNQAN